jgi:hypothetical protein
MEKEYENNMNGLSSKQNLGLWLDLRLSNKAMNYLWDIIDIPTETQEERNCKNILVGNISKSHWIDDTKDNWLYDNILKHSAETLFFQDWNNYYNVHISKKIRPPKFKLTEMWVNYQKQHEFNPPHYHAGTFSFVIFMKIPTHWKEQHALPISGNSNSPNASDFQFLTPGPGAIVDDVSLPLSPEDEGRMLFFPAAVTHQVFPFYGTEKERITVGGNVFFESAKAETRKFDNYRR